MPQNFPRQRRRCVLRDVQRPLLAVLFSETFATLLDFPQPDVVRFLTNRTDAGSEKRHWLKIGSRDSIDRCHSRRQRRDHGV